jgi:aspartyl-tRNA(Asn)/glutamyl-tRNA(Gln) amidotransferase subunit A
VRLPASYCGTVGLKTTIGLVDKDGVVPLTPMLDTIGPLTNNIADAAALLSALAPPQNERTPGWTPRLAALADGCGPGVAGRRIAMIANLGFELHPDTARVLQETRSRLEALGASVADLTLPQTLCDLSAPAGDLLAIEGYRFYGKLAEADPCLLGAPVRKRILTGRDIPAHRLMAVLEEREQRKREWALRFDLFDAIVTPTTPTPAPIVGEHDEDLAPGLFTRFVNFLDLAALSLPMGATDDGLPIGVQIVVRGYGEPLALEIGAALETHRGALRLGPAP